MLIRYRDFGSHMVNLRSIEKQVLLFLTKGRPFFFYFDKSTANITAVKALIHLK